MFLPDNQLWRSWAAGHDFAIVMEELIRIAVGRLLTGEPKAAPAHGSPPAEVGEDIHGCVAAQRALDSEKEDRAEVSREAGGKGAFPESPDSDRAVPFTGHSKYVAEEFCIDIGWMEIPRRKSFRAKAAGILSRGAASPEPGGSFACLSRAGILDAHDTEQDGEEEESPQCPESLGIKNPKSRKRKVRRQHAGATNAIQHRPAPASKASDDLLLLDQAPSGAPARWEDSNGRSKQWRFSGGEITSLVTIVPNYRLVRPLPPEGKRGCGISRRSPLIR